MKAINSELVKNIEIILMHEEMIQNLNKSMNLKERENSMLQNKLITKEEVLKDMDVEVKEVKIGLVNNQETIKVHKEMVQKLYQSINYKEEEVTLLQNNLKVKEKALKDNAVKVKEMRMYLVNSKETIQIHEETIQITERLAFLKEE